MKNIFDRFLVNLLKNANGNSSMCCVEASENFNINFKLGFWQKSEFIILGDLYCKMLKKHITVITGGPGFGKTQTIRELANLGYRTGSEFARELIEQQLQSGGDMLPWKNMKAFQREILNRRIGFYQSVGLGELAFSDRAIPDQLAFSRFRGFEPSPLLQESARLYRYAETVFVAPPWREIYTTDEIRNENFEDACLLHQYICDTYQELGYQLAELPLTDAASRAQFIINQLTQ